MEAPVGVVITPEREAEIHKILAFRLFKSRAEVKTDWHWRLRRRKEILGHIRQYREKKS